MTQVKENQRLKAVMPFFIVEDVNETIDFYTNKLGFEIYFQQTLEGDDAPSFCILSRDGISIMFKRIGMGIGATPNVMRHEWAPWDACIVTDDPDALFEEFKGKGVNFHRELENTEDGLRAFEIRDNSGYVLCFARLL